MKLRNSATFLLLSVGGLLGGGPAHSESLLIVEPVVHEILGNIELAGGTLTFHDCNGKQHDPSGLEIRATQDTCSGGGRIIAAWSLGDVLNQPVFQAGDVVGTVTAMTVGETADTVSILIEGLTGTAGQFATISKSEIEMATNDPFSDIVLILSDDKIVLASDVATGFVP